MSEPPEHDRHDDPARINRPPDQAGGRRVHPIFEPPSKDDDTQPKLRPGDPATAYLAMSEPLALEDDTSPRPPVPPRQAGTPARALLLVMVMAGMLCICVAIVGLAGVAGYRDGLATNKARATQTVAAEIAQQYAAGVENMDQGLFELAIARFEWIVETVRPPARYLGDSPARLAAARTAIAVTPTATVTPTEAATATLTPAPQPTRTPVPSPATQATAAPDPADPAYLYDQAARAMRLSRYEEAIEWLRSLQALDPNHRPAETQGMLMEALTLQGRIYLRGANEDGEDQLARGILLIYEADDLGTVEPQSLLYEADVAERYLNARSYVNGGNYAQAIAILEQLCAEAETTCNWGYRGVSVRDLLEQARAGGPAPGEAGGS